MGIQGTTEVAYQSLSNLWAGVLGYIPFLFWALVVLVLGLVIASVIRVIIEGAIKSVRLDAVLRKIGLDTYFERAGLQVNSGHFFGLLVYWFFVIASVEAAAEIIGLARLSDFLTSVIYYIPQVIVAVLIMLATVILANFLRTLVRASVLSAKLHASKFLGTLTWWAVVVFGLLSTLLQLGIAVSIINTVITGLVAMFALAGGLAFGLGGKDYAAHLLEKLRESTEGR